MPRDLPLGNGNLYINFDSNYNIRDIYWPHVGQTLHTSGNISHTGIWVDGQFAWLDAPEWQRTLTYELETLVTSITLVHPILKVRLQINDSVDFALPIFLRRFRVTNLADKAREVRLFFHYDWHILNDEDGNTVFFDPELRSLVAYKGRVYFLQNGQIGEGDDAQVGISSWATGIKDFNGAEGTWRDAEDGELSGNPIAQGSVDGITSLHLPAIAPQANGIAYHWLTVGENLLAVRKLHSALCDYGVQAFLQRTHNYWRTWVNKDEQDFADLPADLVDLYKRSLLVIRTHIDHDGAIIAANDTDIKFFSRDTYSYMWPRDGALVATALSHAGYGEITRNFYRFCQDVLMPQGYLLHKYNPDRSWGSSWHPWIDRNGNAQLPIQEDETALVVYSLWQHYLQHHDIEFVSSLYHTLVVPAAEFLAGYRDVTTKLPGPSFDLWEERRGILAYTTSAVYAGLDAAARFSSLFGEDSLAIKYQDAAMEIKDAALKYLWDEENERFARMITVSEDKSIQKDLTLDSSLCGLFLFGMFSAHDTMLEKTMQQLEETLWVKTPVGGMARYENDYYHQVTKDLKQAQGNPWFICTLWLAQYRIAHATTYDELQQALPLLRWAHDHALASGVLAEQAHPFTSAPLSVSPLTWSHAEYVMTIRWYLGHRRRLLARKEISAPVSSSVTI